MQIHTSRGGCVSVRRIQLGAAQARKRPGRPATCTTHGGVLLCVVFEHWHCAYVRVLNACVRLRAPYLPYLPLPYLPYLTYQHTYVRQTRPYARCDAVRCAQLVGKVFKVGKVGR